MSSLQPTIGSLFSNTIAAMTHNFGRLLLAIAGLVAMGFILGFVGELVAQAMDRAGRQTFGYVMGFLQTLGVSFVVHAIIIALAEQARGVAGTLSGALRTVLDRFGAFLLITLLLYVMKIVIGLLLAMVAEHLAGWFALLMLPVGLIFVTLLIGTLPAMYLDKLTPFAAIGKAIDLALGCFWPVFGYLFALTIVGSLLLISVPMVLGALIDLHGSFGWMLVAVMMAVAGIAWMLSPVVTVVCWAVMDRVDRLKSMQAAASTPVAPAYEMPAAQDAPVTAPDASMSNKRPGYRHEVRANQLAWELPDQAEFERQLREEPAKAAMNGIRLMWLQPLADLRANDWVFTSMCHPDCRIEVIAPSEAESETLGTTRHMDRHEDDPTGDEVPPLDIRVLTVDGFKRFVFEQREAMLRTNCKPTIAKITHTGHIHLLYDWDFIAHDGSTSQGRDGMCLSIPGPDSRLILCRNCVVPVNFSVLEAMPIARDRIGV